MVRDFFSRSHHYPSRYTKGIRKNALLTILVLEVMNGVRTPAEAINHFCSGFLKLPSSFEEPESKRLFGLIIFNLYSESLQPSKGIPLGTSIVHDLNKMDSYRPVQLWRRIIPEEEGYNFFTSGEVIDPTKPKDIISNHNLYN